MHVGEDTAQTQYELWSLIKTALEPLPQLEGLFVSSMNDVVVSQLSTEAVWSNRIPTGAWILIVVTSIGGTLLIGFRARQTDWLYFWSCRWRCRFRCSSFRTSTARAEARSG
jgi:hypothetical protein